MAASYILLELQSYANQTPVSSTLRITNLDLPRKIFMKHVLKPFEMFVAQWRTAKPIRR